jgi:hypothetical protein
MVMEKPPDEKAQDKPAKPPADREARLAAALRENLRRRKAQARARSADQTPPGPLGKPPAEPGSGG